MTKHLHILYLTVNKNKIELWLAYDSLNNLLLHRTFSIYTCLLWGITELLTPNSPSVTPLDGEDEKGVKGPTLDHGVFTRGREFRLSTRVPNIGHLHVPTVVLPVSGGVSGV